MSFTQFVGHLLNFTREKVLFENDLFYKIVDVRKLNHLRNLSDKAKISKLLAC